MDDCWMDVSVDSELGSLVSGQTDDWIECDEKG